MPVTRADPRTTHPNLVLGICCMSLLLVGMDVTIVNVALPAIQRDLHATLSGLQWIIDSYTLVVASLLMLAGSMADRFGRRRIFQLGLVCFTLGSLLCSLSASMHMLIAFRAIQGLGACMLNPVALSIITEVFPAPRDRARAIGFWGAVFGVSLALGPLLGGLLTQTIGWRSIFWVNLPIGIAALVLTARFVPESRALRSRALDPIGQALVIVALATLTYAVIEGPRTGWASGQIVALFSTSALSILLLLFYEPRRKQPLLDLRFFRSVPFSSATLIAICALASFAGFLFLNALYLQQVRALPALNTGLLLLPLALTLMIFAPLSGRLVGSRGPRLSLLLSGSSILLSTLMLTRLTESTPLLFLQLPYILFGIGLGMVNPAISNSAIAGMPRSQAGVAAAIASTGRQVGAALGVAIAGTVVSTSRTHGISFTSATHPIWWAMAASGAAIALLGWLGSTPLAIKSAQSIAPLLENSGT